MAAHGCKNQTLIFNSEVKKARSEQKSLNLKHQNNASMNLQLEINIIKKELEEMQDESLVQTIKSLLKFAHKKTYESTLKPMTTAQYRARATASEKDIKAGRVKDIEALGKESDAW